MLRSQLVRSTRSSRSLDLYPFGCNRSVVRPVYIRSDIAVRPYSFNNPWSFLRHPARVLPS